MHPPADEQLSNIQEAHADDGETIAHLSQQLFDFATFGKSIESKLAKLGRDFDMSLLDEALALSEQLAKLPAGPAEPSPESKKWSERRNRLVVLILQRVQLIQKVARFKFRNHPDIKQKFDSKYERRRSLAALKKRAIAANKEQREKEQAELTKKKEQIREKLIEERLAAEVKAELDQQDLKKK